MMATRHIPPTRCFKPQQTPFSNVRCRPRSVRSRKPTTGILSAHRCESKHDGLWTRSWTCEDIKGAQERHTAVVHGVFGESGRSGDDEETAVVFTVVYYREMHSTDRFFPLNTRAAASRALSTLHCCSSTIPHRVGGGALAPGVLGKGAIFTVSGRLLLPTLLRTSSPNV